MTPSSLPASVDVAVVGGGIAGSAVAALLAEDGLGVLVVERERRFRDRVRGEALHPWGAAEADRLGFVPVLRAAGARPLPIWQRYEDRAPVEPFRWAEVLPEGHVEWAVPHPALQERMLDHAASRGARVARPARVTGVRRLGRGSSELELATADGVVAVRARLVVGADGARSAARRWLGAKTIRDPVHHAIGGALFDGVDLPEDRTHQAYPPGGMVVVFPQGNGRARAYVVCDPERADAVRGPGAAADFVAACAAPLPEGAFDDAVPAGPAAFFPAADVWADRLAGDGVVLVGDAAGATDPSQGHGLSLAFRDARELRDALRDDADWERATAGFAARRETYVAPLRAHARWAGLLTVDQGPEADVRRERVARAREADPTAGGFAGIYAFGPDGLVADEAARRHFFGEDLPVPELAATR
jgi:2-polyprenyl-6-methoxyphenol hydroxylase-like FAD-dependent oxidoreductase